MHNRAPFSWRNDPAVPAFDDGEPVMIFDGHCVLCSDGVQWMLARDPGGATRFLAVQSPLARALYTHFELDPDRFDTFLVLRNGAAFVKWRGWLEAARTMPAPWRWLGVAGHVVPSFAGDVIYDLVQRNRFDWFGRRETCLAPDRDTRDRFL